MVGGQHRLNKEDFRFHMVSIMYATIIGLIGLLWALWRAIVPYSIIIDLPPFINFLLTIFKSHVVFFVIWIGAVEAKLIAPYTERREYKRTLILNKLKHKIEEERQNSLPELSELENRIDTLEQKVESREDLMWLYFKTLKRLLGTEDKVHEEVDIQWQLEEALLH